MLPQMNSNDKRVHSNRFVNILRTQIPLSDLTNLNQYSYKSNDYSFLANYVFKSYWNWAASLFPLWMAPNLITVLGLSFMVISLLPLAVYSPNLKDEAPSLIYFLFALCTWLNSTFDNVDGKQARRTNSSSALGELMDHGCDALSINIVCMMLMAAFGTGTDVFFVGIPIMLIAGFYLCTWETFHTGSLNLGYINGPTEGVVVSVTFFLITALCGSLLVSNILNISIISVLLRRKNSSSLLEALSTLIPLAFLCSSYYFWATGAHSKTFSANPIMFMLTFGIIFGRITTKIILSHILLAPFPYFTVLMVPLGVGSILANTWPR